MLTRTIIACALVLSSSGIAAQAFHEAPGQGDVVSGVSLIRGWVCDAEEISFTIDEGDPVEAIYGNSRADTRLVCGDNDNGYAFLINWGILPRGPHRLSIQADGATFETVDFEVQGTGREFITDFLRRDVVYDIPEAGRLCTTRWDTPSQNLQLVGCTLSQASGPGTDDTTGTVTLPVGLTGPSQQYHAYIPLDYNPSQPMALVIALHGAGGNGTAPAAARAAREDWAVVARDEGFIVAAPEATGNGGGWSPRNDAALIGQIINDMAERYNIELARVYLWGYSAGGHFGHAIALNNTDVFAAYAVNAGALEAFAGTEAPGQADRNIPVLLQVGDDDPLVPLVVEDRAAFTAAGWIEDINFDIRIFDGGHIYRLRDLETAWEWMELRVLPE